jgi:purine-nucleoside phosphorylase
MTTTAMTSVESAASERLAAAVRRAAGADALDLAIILGSGWGEALGDARLLAEFPYRDWPCFPAGDVAGHAGHLQVLDWLGWRVLAFVGRWHCYQGLSALAVTAPVRFAAGLGVPRLMLTCATGGIAPAMRPGDFMLIVDHLNFLGDNPLKGPQARFVDLTALYRTDDHADLAAAAGPHGVTLHRGVLAALSGPSYETPAEIAMLARFGADAVAMSTVPEAIMARSLGQEVLGLALIANLAAGRGAGPIDHQEVLACGGRSTAAARDLLATAVRCWQRAVPPSRDLSRQR